MNGLAGVLTSYALSGWETDDVFEAIEDVRRSGQRILDSPRNPHGYLRWLLHFTAIDAPPAARGRGRGAAQEERRGGQVREGGEPRRRGGQAAGAAPP
ncbi:hypothetical protein, partial [Nocardia carnea]|uniref:hypothetical protein n=1 Tax=Nocardia carnea TaxID=37328 RepID=UPI0024548B98